MGGWRSARRGVACGGALVGSVLVASCVQQPPPPAPAPAPAAAPAPPPPPPPPPMVSASTVIRDAAGRQVGTATFTDTYAGLLIVGSIGDLGLGAHGVHLHAVGKCETPFTSAGDHFNPTNRVHGFKNVRGPHQGDMPNFVLPAAGMYKFELILPNVKLKGPQGLLDADGASIVVHAARDDYSADPSGNSGGRIACGVITQTK